MQNNAFLCQIKKYTYFCNVISKAKLKDLSRYRLAKNCEADQLFVVEGAKMVEEAIAAAQPIRTLCATADWLGQNDAVHKLEACEVYEVADCDLERLSNFKNANNVWALIERTEITPPASATGAPIFVLDHIQDPGNMGTIMRTADWFGCRTIVCSINSASCYNPKVVQATMGAIFRTKVIYTDIVEYLKGCGLPIYGALLDGADVYSTELESPSVLVIGNESKGISKEVRELVTHPISIPNIGGTAESLNASAATGILCSMFMKNSIPSPLKKQ